MWARDPQRDRPRPDRRRGRRQRLPEPRRRRLQRRHRPNWFSYDSGAIMVGAGNAPNCGRTARARPARLLELRRPPERAGLGQLRDHHRLRRPAGRPGGTPRTRAAFSGTSSASPIVAAAAAIVSSVAEASRRGALRRRRPHPLASHRPAAGLRPAGHDRPAAQPAPGARRSRPARWPKAATASRRRPSGRPSRSARAGPTSGHPGRATTSGSAPTAARSSATLHADGGAARLPARAQPHLPVRARGGNAARTAG